MADSLVTWFSRSGSTERLGRALAERLGADAEPILTSGSYAGAAGFALGLWQSLRRGMPPIHSGPDPDRYRLVIIGTPVWAGRPAAPVRSWLRQHGPGIHNLAAFCVSGSGADYGGIFDDMEELAGRRPAPTLNLAQRQLQTGEADSAIDAFVARLGEARVRTA